MNSSQQAEFASISADLDAITGNSVSAWATANYLTQYGSSHARIADRATGRLINNLTNIRNMAEEALAKIAKSQNG